MRALSPQRLLFILESGAPLVYADGKVVALPMK
jgi:hypothetical protein